VRRANNICEIEKKLRYADEPTMLPQWMSAPAQVSLVFLKSENMDQHAISIRVADARDAATTASGWIRDVGGALMATALEHLLRDNYREAVLWTLANYGRGKIFYEKTGWLPDGRTHDDGRQVLYRHRLAR
jgi:hypothetical protein